LALRGTWSYLYGTRDGQHVIIQNVNGDWGVPPTSLFADVLEAAI
jgi:D-alanyl-D-alanine carboxypeptidase